LNLERSVTPLVGCATRIVCRRGCAQERGGGRSRVPFMSPADAQAAGYDVREMCQPRATC
jgi:hypothetical protein